MNYLKKFADKDSLASWEKGLRIANAERQISDILEICRDTGGNPLEMIYEKFSMDQFILNELF